MALRHVPNTWRIDMVTYATLVAMFVCGVWFWQNNFQSKKAV